MVDKTGLLKSSELLEPLENVKTETELETVDGKV